jgi:hypothetical protein
MIIEKSIYIEPTFLDAALPNWRDKDFKQTGGKYSLAACSEKSGRMIIAPGVKLVLGRASGPPPMVRRRWNLNTSCISV